MKLIPLILALTLTLTACGNDTPAPSQNDKPKSEAIYVLFANDATVEKEDQEDALALMRSLLHQLTKLANRRETRDTQIYILLTSQPNRVNWSGTPEQLTAQAASVVELLQFKNSFSDLKMAFEQIFTTLNLTMPSIYRIYSIGPFVNVPHQLGGGNNEIEVKVPQPIPKELLLNSLASRAKTLKLFRVHEDQDEMLRDYLQAGGVIKAARQGDIDFALLGPAQSSSAINDLL